MIFLKEGALVLFRKPKKNDGKAIFELVRSCAPPLDLNSRYLYFLIGAHFSETSAVVEQNDFIVGFTSAYILPDKKDHLFVWQVAVHEGQRSIGIAQGMLDDILSRSVCQGIRYLETTITTSNDLSKRLFKGFAKGRGAECREELFLDSTNFVETIHEEEILFRIGPLTTLTK
ncbi:MAG: L-2,4-diaminobutyric acid acetyltransferase [Candidatus Scalindua rubra]|uniref:L-2,4-diaminobutyric acid acetyltransferase n=1 Tax=Candidatus Scalindua rubra TaxID=1872076 RepID=A0A1E3X3Z3_9BACT|nr:MAG: L-2,4-diaminobutyric acid acetyltransferase [Candidatus Scalindua rubra]